MPCGKVLAERSLLGGDATASLHAFFPPTPSTASMARAMVNTVLDDVDDVDEDVRWAAALLTSELVTNAIVHSRTHVHLGIAHDGEHLLIAVADGTGEGSPLGRVAVDEDESGRGMLLVATVADDFGWRVNDDGQSKTIWVLIRLTTGSPLLL